jgi:aspartyl-tRNA(Asn)/glutamyl-tRNA(Gln) amidotransferase subunit A
MELTTLGALEVSRRIISGEMSCEEYVSQLLEKTRALNPRLNAFISIRSEESVLADAKGVDRKVRLGDKKKLGRLAGLGIAIKDNICTRGLRTTCASRMLENFVPPYDATVIERIRAEGGIIIGKTNMDEFAMGNTTANSAFGAVVNPLREGHTPGGSSGGSAAAVASGMSTLALGSDTGGSIRCPASFCSIVGLKPSYGLVSRYGLIEYANSLEQIGPMAKDVEGTALLLGVISGHDPRDSTSDRSRGSADYLSGLQKSKERPRLAIARESLGEGTDSAVASVIEKAVGKLKEMGAIVEEVSIQSLRFALAAYYITAMAEASSNLARYDGVRYGSSSPKGGADWNEAYSRTRSEYFGTEVKRRILLGTFTLSAGYFDAYYLRAQKVRSLLAAEVATIFKRYDMLVGPTMPVLPPRYGDAMSAIEEYAIDVTTVPANLIGIPAISLPCGNVDGLPVGLQLTAPHWGEEILLRTARSFERGGNTP